MAFVRLIFTAKALTKLQKELVQEKEEAYKFSKGEKTKRKFKLSHIAVSIKESINRCCSLPEKSCLHRFCYKLKHDGSCENYTLKSVFGFCGGILLTYVLFIFFIFQLNLKLTTATVLCSTLGCILTVGLAFSTKIRCIVLLTLPQFFSKKGRQALLAYGFILALTGPAQNTLNNLGILSESLACGQEQLKQAVQQIIDVIKKPFLAIKEAIKKVIKTVKEVVKMIKEIFLKIKRIIMALVKIIKAAFEFLGKIINICNKELGTPFERCSRVFENAILDCHAKLGPIFSWMCSITYIVKGVCYIVKIFDYVCMLVDFFTDSVIGVVIRKVKSFIRQVKTMFYVRVKFAHSYKFETTASKTLKEIAQEIVKEIKDRSKGIVAFFRFMTSAAVLFFIFIVFQVTYYRIKYLTSERFDNIYITQYFRQIDMRRARLEKEAVLPLNKREERIYVPIGSGKLAKIERKSLVKSMTTLGIATVKLGTHMLFDYCLYWIMELISYHARFQSKPQLPALPSAQVTGEGILAKLLKVILKAFQPVGIQLEIDTVPCLPKPIPPSYDRYVQIAIVLIICWILTFLEPYGLRFRNYIMGYYHPVRAKQRTIWLYNHILRSRVSFLDLARRALKRKFGYKGADKITCKEWLRSHLKCGIFRICLGSDLEEACMVCGEVFRETDSKKPIRCATPGCPGIFCKECFKDLNNICPICLNPIEYGEVEDEEKDSSGDEGPPPKPPKKRRKPCRWFPCKKAPDEDKTDLVSSEEEPVQDKYDDDSDRDDAEALTTQEAEVTDTSTEYSDTYQYEDAENQDLPKPYPIQKDVEKQVIPDYESMESFREIELEQKGMEETEPLLIELEIDNKLKLEKGKTARVELSVSSEVTDAELEDEVEMDSVSLLNRHGSEENRHVKFIGLPEYLQDNLAVDTKHKDFCNKLHKSFNKTKRKVKRKPKINSPVSFDSKCNCSEMDFIEESSFITLPKSTMSTSTRNDCQCCHMPIIERKSSFSLSTDTKEDLENIRRLVPPLDLSFVDTINNDLKTNSARILSERFKERVKYEEVCETPICSPKSPESFDSSSSVLTDLQNSPPVHIRRRNVKVQCEKPRYQENYVQVPSALECHAFERNQNKKTHNYYKADYEYPGPRCQKQKKKSVRNLLQKVLPKRYSKPKFELPLHNRLGEEDFEIQSYNYCQQDWESFNSPNSSFRNPSSSENGETAHLLAKEEEKSRLRGGQCFHLENCKQAGSSCKNKCMFNSEDRTSKGFSRLSFPPKPKSFTPNELLSRYFTSIEDLTPTRDPGCQMSQPESAKGVSFSPTNIESAYNLTDRTASSTDSCLSEATCRALFGGPCPAGLRQKLNKGSGDIYSTPSGESSKEKSPSSDRFKNNNYQQPQGFLDAHSNSKVNRKPAGSQEHQGTRSSQEIIEEVKATGQSTGLEKRASLPSKQSLLSNTKQTKEAKKEDSATPLETGLEQHSTERYFIPQSSIEKIKSPQASSLLPQTSNQASPIQLPEQLEINSLRRSSVKETDSLHIFPQQGSSQLKSPEVSDQTRQQSAEHLKDIAKSNSNNKISAFPQVDNVLSLTQNSTEQPEKDYQIGHVKSSPQNSGQSKISSQGSGQIKTGSKESLKNSCSLLSNKGKSPTQLAFEKLEKIQETPEELHSTLPKPQGSHLNQLLYKDDKTEICLVQNLGSNKKESKPGSIQNSAKSSISEPVVKAGQSPLVKLHVNLHNSLISEDNSQIGSIGAEIEMDSPKSKDKVVETKEVFPLRKDWLRDSASTSRIILASDKQQQTSDNDFYHASNNTVNFRKKGDSTCNTACCKCKESTPLSHQPSSSSALRRSSIESHYSDTPERDSDEPRKATCKCIYQKPIQKHRQTVDQETSTDSSSASIMKQECNCCRCINCRRHKQDYEYQRLAKTPPREFRTEYRTLNFPSTSSEYSIPFNQTHPSWPHTRNHSPRKEKTSRKERTPRMDVPPRMEAPPPPFGKHGGKCYEGCRCCYSQPRPPNPPPLPTSSYRYNREYHSYSDEDQDFEESHSNASLTDLPYQDKEEYMDLVQELQDTLHSRNRNRVRRAMQEFEQRSKHNQPLEKPIINYDEASESEEPIIRKINELTEERKRCCAEKNCKCGTKSHRKRTKLKGPRKTLDVSPDRPCHWSMDGDSGEWYRKYQRQQKNHKFGGYDEEVHCNCNCERRMK